MIQTLIDQAIQRIIRRIDAWLDHMVEEEMDVREGSKRVLAWFNPRGTGKSLPNTLAGRAAAGIKTILRTETTKTLSNEKAWQAVWGGHLVKWNLAPSHPRTDLCDSIAEEDQGWGPGVYKPGTGPVPPAHPNCRCYLSNVPMPESVQGVAQVGYRGKRF